MGVAPTHTLQVHIGWLGGMWGEGFKDLRAGVRMCEHACGLDGGWMGVAPNNAAHLKKMLTKFCLIFPVQVADWRLDPPGG